MTTPDRTVRLSRLEADADMIAAFRHLRDATMRLVGAGEHDKAAELRAMREKFGDWKSRGTLTPHRDDPAPATETAEIDRLRTELADKQRQVQDVHVDVQRLYTEIMQLRTDLAALKARRPIGEVAGDVHPAYLRATAATWAESHLLASQALDRLADALEAEQAGAEGEAVTEPQWKVVPDAAKPTTVHVSGHVPAPERFTPVTAPRPLTPELFRETAERLAREWGAEDYTGSTGTAYIELWRLDDGSYRVWEEDCVYADGTDQLGFYDVCNQCWWTGTVDGKTFGVPEKPEPVTAPAPEPDAPVPLDAREGLLIEHVEAGHDYKSTRHMSIANAYANACAERYANARKAVIEAWDRDRAKAKVDVEALARTIEFALFQWERSPKDGRTSRSNAIYTSIRAFFAGKDGGEA